MRLLTHQVKSKLFNFISEELQSIRFVKLPLIKVKKVAKADFFGIFAFCEKLHRHEVCSQDFVRYELWILIRELDHKDLIVISLKLPFEFMHSSNLPENIVRVGNCRPKELIIEDWQSRVDE